VRETAMKMTMKRLAALSAIALSAALAFHTGALRADDDGDDDKPAVKPTSELPLKLVKDVALSGRPARLDYQSLDSKTHLLFIAHLGDGFVTAFDVEKGKVVHEIRDVSQVHGVLAIPALGRCYASATGTKEVVAIDEKTFEITARMPGGGYPDGMAWDPETQKLYVSDESGGGEVVIDTKKNEKVATIDIGGEAGNTQYDPASKRVFVNNQTTNELIAIDPTTDKVVGRTKVPGGEGNHGLLIEPERRLAFLACQGNDKLVVLDMKSMKVVSSHPIGRGNDVLAFDPGLRRLYVSSESGVVSVFELGEAPSTEVKKIGEAFLAKNAHTVAVDADTHRVYFPLKDVGGKPALWIMEPVVHSEKSFH
jgi:DNA-binding beta-propeller fold protein YncE